MVPDIVWNMVPGNITNAAGVAQGDPPQFRARPTWGMPAVHANNAAAAVVSIYREEATKISPKQAVPSPLPSWIVWEKPIEPTFERLFPR